MNIEGRNPVAEAIRSGRTIEKVMIQKGVTGSGSELIGKLKTAGIKLQFVEKQVLDKLSESGKHQGFIASVTDFKYADFEDIASASGRKLILILDGINDPHNLGSIIRTAECAGASVVIGKNRCASVTDTVERVSAGACSHVAIARVANINDAVRKLKERGVWVYAAEAGGQSIYDADLKGDVALIIGGEGDGVSHLTKELADGVVSLPMMGKINSLNAGVAAGIAVYETLRQNGVNKK